ncbi:hypothetical protein WG66_010668 [Moniliophthora roreri]|nr:hypothetical protein WG66_010668 [Moniliophthora roreri]
MPITIKIVQGQAEQSGQGQGTPTLDAVQEEGQNSTRQSAVTENELYKPLAGKFNKVLEHTQEATGKPPLITFSSTPSKGLKSEGAHGGYIADINALLVDTTAVGDQAGKEQFECDIVMTGEFKKVVNDSDTDDICVWFDDRAQRYEVLVLLKVAHLRNRKSRFAEDVIYFVMALGSASKEQLGFDPTVRRVKRSSGSKVKTRYRFTINGIEYETLEAINIYKAKFLLGRANRVFKVQRVVNDELIGPVFVLKDLWLPEGAKTELEIQEDMKANINKVHVVEGLDAADFEKHFVAIKHCEIVKVPSMTDPSELVDDNSTNFLRGNDLSSPRKKFVLKLITIQYPKRPSRSLAGSQMSDSTGSLPIGHRAQTHDICMLSREHYGNKAHHRIVMEDAGCPLQDVRNLRTVVTCIGKASTGLSIMFSAGMVHRDISTGNLLVSEVDGELGCKITDLEYAKKVGASSQSPQDIKTRLLRLRVRGLSQGGHEQIDSRVCLEKVNVDALCGLSIMFSAGMVHRDISTGNLLVSEVDGELRCKITDLEYARKVSASSESPQDIKTGTPYFMALEIWMGHYLFLPQEPTDSDSDSKSDDENFVSMLKRRGARPDTRAPVQYNFLHDLESLFWILVYFLLIMHPVNDMVEVNAGNDVNERIISHRMHTFHELFPSFSNFYFGRRIEFLKGNESIHSQYLSSVPKQFVVTMRFAIVVSRLLRVEYQRVEALPESTTAKFSAKPYKRLQSYAATLAGSEEKRFWLGEMFDMSEYVVPNVERTIQEDGGMSKKRAAEEVTGDLSTREGKRIRQSKR